MINGFRTIFGVDRNAALAAVVGTHDENVLEGDEHHDRPEDDADGGDGECR